MLIRNITAFEQELLDEVNADMLMDYTHNIAKEVRLSGTPEEARAFAYIKTKLEEFGLTTELMYADAYISLPRSASLTAGGQAFNCITHAMAKSTGPDGLTGSLVYAGKGTPADYDSLDVAGKIVLLEGLAMGAVVKLAQEKGAAGLIFINAEYTHEMVTSYVWGSPTPETWPLLPQLPIIAITIKDGEILKSLLSRNEPDETIVYMQTEVETGWRQIPTLTATIPGTKDRDKFLLLSGHVDGWHYGAMDNSSANAAMLEVARILSKHREKLSRSVRLAFWSGHSHGRYAGSTWYCDNHFEDLYDNCFLHINVDSLGAKGADILTEANCMAETKDLAAGVIAAVAGQEFFGTRFGRAGDQSFWGTGTPSLFMGLSEQALTPGLAAEAFAALFGNGKTGGFGWWWHTTEDTIDKIDPANLVRDCRVYLLALYRACTDAILPINQLAAVQEIAGALENYAKTAGGRVDLTLAIARAQKLGNLVKNAYDNLPVQVPPGYADKFNEYLMELSRILVPLNYVKGSIYQHDLALRQAAVPVLAEINLLPSTAPDSDEARQLNVLLTRRLNQVTHPLQQAIRLTERLLDSVAR